jgi:diguanylate cyclase (GGDEF)-like protein
VDRRIRDTAEQAVAHAAMALGRAVLSERISSAAHTDGLTGLGNRRLFDTSLVRETERSRFTGDPVSLLMIDLDQFKQLNDRHGHQTGDEVLRQAAAVLRDNCGNQNLAARYGGEEFAVILSGCGIDDAALIAENIRAALVAADTAVPVTASIGVATSLDHGTDAPAILRAADAALYAAKADGRNRVVRAPSTRELVA